MGFGEVSVSSIPTLAQVEENHIRFVLDHCGGNCERAHKILGVGRATLFRKAKEFKINLKQLRKEKKK